MTEAAGDDDPIYGETVRELLGELVDRRIVGLTQHDKAEFRDGAPTRVELHLDNGAVLILIGTGDVRLERPDGSAIQIGLPDPEEE